MSHLPVQRLLAACAGLSLAAGSAFAVSPQPTSFTYQGVLEDAGSLVNGPVAISFALFDASAGGSQVGPTLNIAVTPEDGIFSQTLDFGAGSFADGQARWIQLTVDGQTLPRQLLTSTPYALNTRGIRVDEAGTVDIGSVIRLNNPTSSDWSIFAASANRLGISNPIGGTQFIFDTDGNLGIGTLMPATKLHIDPDGLGLVPQGESYLAVARDGSNYINLLSAEDRGGGIFFGDPARSDVGGIVYAHATNSISFRNNGNLTRMLIGGNGDITIGNANLPPIGDVTIRPTSGNADLVLIGAGQPTGISLGAGSNGLGVGKINADGSGFELLGGWQNNGFLGVGTATPTTMLDVNGAVTIRGGADIVEGFDSICDTAFEPGTVLVIDPDNPGKLMCADVAYDRRVAGVVSGAGGVLPGIKLGQDGVMDGDIPVAMTGRVYVKASAENGAIEPGDLLTTSSVPGHAMKATDHDRSNGSVIGKAMSDLDSGTGLVLVLVNLQ